MKKFIKLPKNQKFSFWDPTAEEILVIFNKTLGTTPANGALSTDQNGPVKNMGLGSLSKNGQTAKIGKCQLLGH